MAERPGKSSISASPDDVSGRRRPAQGSRRRTPKDREGRMIGLNLILAVLVFLLTEIAILAFPAARKQQAEAT